MRSGLDLRIQIGRHGLGIDAQDTVQQIGTSVEQGLELAIIAACTAFDHVAGQGERAAGKTDQRHGIVERTTDFCHGVGHIAQTIEIGRMQRRNGLLIAQGALEFRPLAFAEIKPQPHRIGYGQDVGKEDGGIQRIAFQRLQRHLTGQRRVLAQLQEAPGLLARRAILGQIASGLTHHPHRRVVGRFTQQGAQKGVVAGSGHGNP